MSHEGVYSRDTLRLYVIESIALVPYKAAGLGISVIRRSLIQIIISATAFSYEQIATSGIPSPISSQQSHSRRSSDLSLTAEEFSDPAVVRPTLQCTIISCLASYRSF